jgi:hypothetical protein
VIAEGTAAGTLLARVRATDADVSAPNNAVSYAVISGDPNGVFAFDTTTGELRTRGVLDFESGVDSYTLGVRASDGAFNALSVTCMVTVNVTDINDNSPLFNASSYSATIPEGTPTNVTLLAVLATDADSGENGVVQYSLNDPSQRFQISANGVISTSVTANRIFDFEQTREYTVTVVASDVGEPGQQSRTSTVRLVVTISDVNDLPPLFDATTYSAVVPENANGSIVVRVTAVDQDQVAVSVLRYEILTQLSPFVIDSSTGIVTTSQPLDRETIDFYSLQIQVVEVDDASHTDVTTVNINVSDVNDHTPTFSEASRVYFLRLNETTLIGTTLIQFQATDSDLGNNALFDFALVGGNEDRRFTLSQTGLLAVNNGLDFEVNSSYFLTVTVRDRGDPSLSQNATVTIIVLNENDLRPQFNASSYSTAVLEDSPAGQLVGQVFATDSEVGTVIT